MEETLIWGSIVVIGVGAALMLLLFPRSSRRRRHKLVLDTDSFPPAFSPGRTKRKQDEEPKQQL